MRVELDGPAEHARQIDRVMEAMVGYVDEKAKEDLRLYFAVRRRGPG